MSNDKSASPSLKDGYGLLSQDIKGVRAGLTSLWFIALDNYRDGDGVAELLAKCITLLQDAERLAQNPDLKQMHCLNHKGEIHVLAGNGLDTLCGNGPTFMERFLPCQSVPTCPDCIAKLPAPDVSR